MFSHPVTIVGWLLVALGNWLLYLWVPVEQPGSSMVGGGLYVYNFHRADMSWAIMFSGFVLVVIGVIARGFELIAQSKSLPALESNIAEASTTNREPIANVETDVSEDDPEGDGSVFVRDRQGREREIRRTDQGGYVADTITGQRHFSSLEEAKRYFD